MCQEGHPKASSSSSPNTGQEYKQTANGVKGHVAMEKNVPCVSSNGKEEQDSGVGETDYSPCIAHLSLSPTPHASECQFLYSGGRDR